MAKRGAVIFCRVTPYPSNWIPQTHRLRMLYTALRTAVSWKQNISG